MKKGSLLITLLIAVAIIGSLSALIVNQMNKVPKKSSNGVVTTQITPEARSRDAQRKSDAMSLVVALAMYKAEHDACPGNLDVLVAAGMFSGRLVDPRTQVPYSYRVSGKTCIVSATLEDASDPALTYDYDPTNGNIFDRSTSQ